MTDRVPGAPGQYKAVIAETELQKMQAGEQFTITMTRDDQPIVEGTPYSKAAVLPDELAALLCGAVADPTPADAFLALHNKATNRRIYTAHGDIACADAGGTFAGAGTATVTIEPTGLARIDFSFMVTQTGTTAEYFNWGLNRDMLVLRNPDIPRITPVSGGVVAIYGPDGVLKSEMNGFGGVMTALNQFWVPARVYAEADGFDVGQWPDNAFNEHGAHLVGTCYGTVQLD